MVSINDYIGLMPAEQLAADTENRIVRWNDSLYRNGLINTWKRNYRLYYNADPYYRPASYWNDFGVTGDSSEYLSVRINHFRNLMTHMLNMIFAKFPDLKSRASNTTPEALEAIDLNDAIIEHEMRARHIGRHIKKGGELSLLFGTGAILCEWDSSSGEPYITDQSGRLISTGDVRVRAKSPLDFYTDTSKEEWADVEWIIVRDFVNKYVLATQFPDQAEKILNVSNWIHKAVYFFDVNETDDVPVYKFYHKQVQGLLPEGRFCMSVAPDCVLYDGPNPYQGLPIFLIKPSEGLGTFYGYSPSFDMAPLQMFYNMVMSSIATNVAAHGVPNVVGQRGSDISVTQLTGGMNYIEVAPGMEPPQALNLLATPAEVYQLSTMIERIMETISGVNSVARGNPETSLKSGVALGLIQSMAIQFMSGFQQSVINNLEDVGNFILRLNKLYANTPRVVSIVGKDKVNEIRRWSAADIQLVESVYVEPVDPFSQTLAGREQRANNLLDKGLVNPQEYLTVATTGQLEPLYRRPVSELNYVRDENQDLMNGVYVEAMITDNHPLHIDEHLTLTFDKDLRKKCVIPGTREEATMGQILQHIQKHKDMLMQQQAPPMMGPPGAPPGGPQSGPPPSHSGIPNNSANHSEPPNGSMQAQMPRLPAVNPGGMQ